jgi:predicted phosphodiesterase
MKHIILSDVHSNFEALKVIKQDIDSLFVPETYKTWFLGDVIGYGPNPNESLEMLREIVPFEHWIIGNHDLSVNLIYHDDKRWQEEANEINPMANFALNWTAKTLNDSSKKVIDELIKSERYSIRENELSFSHGTPFGDKFREYIKDKHDANYLFFRIETSKGMTAFVGHVHRPKIFGGVNGAATEINLERTYYQGSDEYIMSADINNYNSALIVVPSVGQPRDKWSQTGYLIYDDVNKKVTIRRFKYDVKKTQEDMKKAGLPEYLIDRLGVGC